MRKNILMNNRYHVYLMPLIILFFFSNSISQVETDDLNIMPMPAKMVQKKGTFRLTDSFTVAIENPSAERLGRSATRMLRRLSGRTGLFFPQDFICPDDEIENPSLKLDCERIGKIELNEDESYRLVVKPDQIRLTGKTDIGVMRGLETLLQLVDADEHGYFIPEITIDDKPRFPWRGLLMDVCRHFMPVEVIKRNLDGMSAVKMNVLHWHLSEDQGFRVECKTFPKLHELGSDGFYYTQEQIKEIIAYAADRGIRIMPEFDIPGHSTSWLVGYPELASAPGPYEVQRRWGVHYATFNPTIEETYQFFDAFFAEMSALFPDDYIHIGGDEVDGEHWDTNPDIQTFMAENNISDNHTLQAYFNKRILDILTQHGKKVIGWDEIFQPGLPKSIVIQSWRGRESLYESAQKGYDGILSNGYYIDLIQPTDFHYLNDPLPEDAPLTRKEKQRILGGEATMWAELVSPETVDSRIWPRTAAIAERLWSPMHIRDIDDMYRRLDSMSIQLEELGLTHMKNQEMMLRRLTGGRNTDALKTLMEVTEPLKGYTRHHQDITYTSYSPLTRIVDAAVPDAKVARKFRRSVDQFLEGETGDGEESMKSWLILWSKNHDRLKPIIDRSPILKEIEPLSENLSRIADIGLETVERVLTKSVSDYAWIAEQRRILEQAKEPRGQAELMIVTAVEKMVDSVANISGYYADAPSTSQWIDFTDGWHFRKVGDEMWYDAAVPGCVHTDLLASQLIADPFYGRNEEQLQWIEEKDWEYRTTFVAEKDLLSRDKVEIHFEGLDTYADVYLNDWLLISADNMFCEWRTDCKNYLNEGDNTLRVHFHSPVNEALPLWQNLEYELPGGPKVITRKAGYHYGWDWGPRFVTSGIWRPVYLNAWDRTRITNLHIKTEGITKKKAELTAVFEIESTKKQEATLTLFLEDSRKKLNARTMQLSPGMNYITVDFEIKKPKRWWTNGLGEQPLYTIRGEVEIERTLVDSISERIGLRTIEVVQEPDDAGTSFYVKLNNLPVFMKGANYIPQDNFISRVRKEQYEALMKSAVNAEMNMLRVWGGGIYENDVFYDLCDEHGILIWQDFMFACAMYPGDEDFLKTVRREAIQNIKRLRNHPCIALWCGNNEIDEGWHHWGWQNQFGYSSEDSAEIWNTYTKLFHEMLPAAVKRYDGERFYWPSSPQFGRGNPKSLYEGDSHYWGVWHDAEPFEAFKEKTGRFMSEYGFQSFPEFKTIEYFTQPDDWDVGSKVMLAHQKHPRGNQLIQIYMDRWYKTPRDFQAFLYVSQLLQAEGMKIGIEAHRRAIPFCMGTLYWQLNDCWPVVSWSSIDYFGRWKALHYYVKKAFNDVLVSPTLDNDTVRVHIVSDRLKPIYGTLKLSLMSFSGDVFWEEEKKLEIKPNSSNVYVEMSIQNLLEDVDRSTILLIAEIWQKHTLLSSNLLYFVPPKELTLLTPIIAKHITENEDGYTLELISDKLAKNVFLHIDDGNGFFTDNYFDLLPGKSVHVNCITDEMVENIEEHIKIISLVDTYEQER